MRILVVSDIPTHPVNAGNRNLILAYTDLFKEWGHTVHFLFVNRFYLHKKCNLSIADLEMNRNYWNDDFFVYSYTFIENILSNLAIIKDKLFFDSYRKVDDIYPEGLSKMFVRLNEKYHYQAVIVNYFYLSKLLEVVSCERKALFTHDSFSMHTKSKSNQAAYYLTKEEETKALKRAPYIFAMQDVEADYFRKLHPEGKILINYSNYDCQEQPVAGNHNLLYLSGASAFNKAGLLWFLENIFPLIKQQFNDAKLRVAGNICNMLQEYKNRNDIELVGYIDNPATFYQTGDIAINPCYQGTGLKIKTFEAMAHDKITMVHPHSTIGIYKKEKAPIFASERPNNWVDYLKKVWSSEDCIMSHKEAIRNYMYEMNRFIHSQYINFLEK